MAWRFGTTSGDSQFPRTFNPFQIKFPRSRVLTLSNGLSHTRESLELLKPYYLKMNVINGSLYAIFVFTCLLYIQLCVVVSEITDSHTHTYDDKDVGFHDKLHAIKEGNPPHFYIIGAQKCATSSLYDLFVSKHPNICKSSAKEVHYFDHPNEWERGSQYYSAYFKRDKQCEQKSYSNSNITDNTKLLNYIDATPNYFTNPLVPARLYKSFTKSDRNKKKFILILREPVSREYSWYNHRARFCITQMHNYIKRHSNMIKLINNNDTIWDVNKLCNDIHCEPVECTKYGTYARLNEEANYIANFTQYYNSGNLIKQKSLYLQHIHNWLKYFKREKFFIINLTNLLINTTDTVQRICNFFNIPLFLLKNNKNIKLPHDNAANINTKYDCNVRNTLYPYYKDHNERLYEFLKNSPVNITYEPDFPEFQEKLCSPNQLY